MDKTLLKNFAINARNKLRQEIINQAAMIGITHSGITPPLAGSTVDMVLFDIKAANPYKIYDQEVKQYHKLKEELAKRGKTMDGCSAFDSLVEEVAYTWFNRLIALRFMEVNHYLPDKMRILSSGRAGVNEPEFVTHYRQTSLDFSDQELDQLAEWKMDASALAMEKFFHRLFIKQCNALNDNLPELFEKTDDYAELLLTISYNDPHGVLYQLVHDIPEDYFDVESESGQVEIIGWLYQYYNTERRDEVINILSKKTVNKEDIPAATQLFTTDWVVRYMVDNSLGKYWLERNPDSSIKDSLEYLMPGDIPLIDEKISPEDLKVFDNAMGSGHCLSYAFDVLLMIYESQGYTAREAAKLIVEKNLYGLDIDKRAYQLAYFAIMMKARQHNRKALNGQIKTNLNVFEDSTTINKDHLKHLGQSMDEKERQEALEQIDYLIKEFENATELGSILILEKTDENLILKFINDGPVEGQIIMGQVDIDKTQGQLKQLLQVTNMLTEKYDVMVTNPPYLNKFSAQLKKYIWDNYSDYKKDMFSVFIYKNIELCKSGGYSAYMTPNVWMFIKTYEKLRKYLISQKHIDSLIQIAKGAFYGEATVDVMTFILKNTKSNYNGKFIRLDDFRGDMEIQRIRTLEVIQKSLCEHYYEINQVNFDRIPGSPIAYWISSKLFSIFEKSTPLSEIARPRVGQNTGDNERFLKFWNEVCFDKIGFNTKHEEIETQNYKWIPYSKGGAFRRWYGNYFYVINWERNGEEIKEYGVIRNKGKHWSRYIQNLSYLCCEGVTWSDVSSNKFACRYLPEGFICDVKGSSAYPDNNKNKLYLAFLNSSISHEYLKILAPTISFQTGDISRLPFIMINKMVSTINIICKRNIELSKNDWDSFETSWDFRMHPLLDNAIQKYSTNNNQLTLEQSYENWKAFTNNNFTQLKQNEEELNRIFIEIYGLEDELNPQVSDKDITITKIFDHKNEIYDDIKGNRYILTKEEVIKSFISYAIACIFGRYSLDNQGLAYAGGDWDDGNYQSFIPVKDNVVLITDFDYFEDDLVNRLVDFVRVAFGQENLQENLVFMADSLGTKGTPKEVLSNYLLKDFYKDHVRTYQKRPIYWLYDSGKGNGFKALIYMHRYDQDTTGRVRIDYLHQVQKAYEFRMDNLKYEIANSKNAREIAAAEKELVKLTKQLKECKDYDEKIGHLALARIPIDLDDGVKVNYQKVQVDEKGKNLGILAKI